MKILKIGTYYLCFTILALACRKNEKLDVPDLVKSATDLYSFSLPKDYPNAFEPYLAVNQNKAIVGFIGRKGSSFFTIYRRVFYTDGTKVVSPDVQRFGNELSTGSADPCLVYDKAGNLHTINVVNFKLGNDTRNAIHYTKLNPNDLSIIRSTLIGEHSKKGNLPNLTRDPDKCWMKVNENTGHIYIAWSGLGKRSEADIYFVKSTDGGVTFSTPISIVKDGKDNFYVQLETLGENTLLMLWDTRGDGVLKYSISTNNGQGFSEPKILFTNPSSTSTKETMGPILIKNADGSLSLAVTMLINDKSFSTTILQSSDNGSTWSQVGNKLESTTLATAFKVSGKNYVIGYRVSNKQAQYNLWQLTNGIWQPKLIKKANTDGYQLRAGDYVGAVVQGNSIFTSYVFPTINGERKIFVTKIDL